MVLLESLNSQPLGLDGTHSPDAGFHATHGGEDRNPALDGGTANFDFVFSWRLAAGRIDDQGNFVVLHQVNNVRTSFVQFKESMHGQTCSSKRCSGSAGGIDGKPDFD